MQEPTLPLLLARADVSIIASSAATYFTKTLNLTNSIYFSEKTQSDYKRFILVQPQLGPIHTFLNTFSTELSIDEKWKELLGKYGLEALN